MPEEAMEWLFCKDCNRVLRKRQAELRKHGGHRLRNAGNEPFWHVLYRPVLLWEWLCLKLGR